MAPTFSILSLSIAAAVFASPAPPSRALLNKLPLRFEQGSDGKPVFTARGAHFELKLAPSRHTLEWTDPSSGRVARITTEIRGANEKTGLEAEQRLPGSANYFLGPREQWRMDVPGYARVRHKGVQPGIDLIFHGEGGLLEYDFVLAPHADPSLIRMSLTGQRSLSIDGEGNLLVATDAGLIRWKRPETYQQIGGTRRSVDGRFVTDGRSHVSFKIGPYDRERELVIDPTLTLLYLSRQHEKRERTRHRP